MPDNPKPFLISDLLRQMRESDRPKQQLEKKTKNPPPKETRQPVRVVSFRSRNGSKVLPMEHRTFSRNPPP